MTSIAAKAVVGDLVRIKFGVHTGELARVVEVNRVSFQGSHWNGWYYVPCQKTRLSYTVRIEDGQELVPAQRGQRLKFSSSHFDVVQQG